MYPDTGKIITYKSVEVFPTDKIPEDKQRAIAGIKEGKYGIEVAQCDRIKALELLGGHLGMFKDKVELLTLTKKRVSLIMLSHS